MKFNLLMATALVLSATISKAELQEMTDSEMSAENICGITEVYLVEKGVKKSIVGQQACAVAILLDAAQVQIQAQESLAVIDARNAANNVAIERSQLKSTINAAIAKQDQAALALQKSLLNQSYSGDRRTVALDFIGQLQGIAFGQTDGTTKTFTRIIDDGCTGSSICFHTETRTIDTSKVDQGILKLQIK